MQLRSDRTAGFYRDGRVVIASLAFARSHLANRRMTCFRPRIARNRLLDFAIAHFRHRHSGHAHAIHARAAGRRVLIFSLFCMAIPAHRSECAGQIACGGQRGHRKQQRHDRDSEYAPKHHPVFDATTDRFVASRTKEQGHRNEGLNKNACDRNVLLHVVIFGADVLLNLPVRFQLEGPLRGPGFFVRFRIVNRVFVH